MRVGILGGGQLGRMLALAGYPLDVRTRCLDPASDAPAGQVTELVVGDYTDPDALARLVDGCDAVTCEFENVPAEAAAWLAEHVPVRPGPRALAVAQDRMEEKRCFERLRVPTARFAPVSSASELRAALELVGVPAVLKTRRLGYDGKGQAVVRSAAEAEDAFEALGRVPLIAEAFVPFRRELSILSVRAVDGTVAFWPLVENRHADGILRRSVAPAPDVSAILRARAEECARAVLESLDYVGVLAIELFDTGHELLANEMAPRVHNSGHWTIEGAVTSQFENHLRAVAGLPLGATAARGMSVMLNVLGTPPPLAELAAIPGAHVHLYGKSPRPRRKIGHVTLTDLTDPTDGRVVRVERLLEG